MIIHNLLVKLTAGWNPWTNAGNSRQFTPLLTIISKYRNYIKSITKKNVMKEKTAKDYLSRTCVLEEFLGERSDIKYVYQLDRTLCIDFLDHLLYDRDVNARTRNNYRSWLCSFGTWLKDRQYVSENPAMGIHSISETEKFRDPLTPDALKRLREYLYENDKYFLLACLFEYYTFIRPNELTQIKLGDISIKEQTVFVSGAISKNKKDGYVGLNDEIIKLMIELHTFDAPSQSYLFSNDRLRPGDKRAIYHKLRIEWNKTREALHFPAEYQFYSLKDTGIRDLANAEGIVVAKEQARHSDISITNRYLKNQTKVNEETKHFKGGL